MPSDTRAHPWMASSAPGQIAAMLAEIGAPDVDSLFAQIPAEHLRRAPLDLPPALDSEVALKRHLDDLLSRNRSDMLCFLGAGCWPHHVPAVVDEIVGRTEFSTNVWGSYQSDHGRNQAWFEYQSQLGELLDMEVVQLPVYSWGCAVGHAIRMAARMTGRRRVLVPRWTCPERLAVIRTYCEPPEMASHIAVETVEPDHATGGLDMADLKGKLGPDVCAVYLENPTYLGALEPMAAEIARLARAAGAETIMGCDPLSLGVLASPGSLGADIAVGPTQPMGVRMNAGGGVGGYMASRDDVRYVREYNGFLVSIAETRRPGERGFGLASAHQTSYGMREQGKDWTGNSVYLWAIANAVYMSLMGPQGFREIGELIMARSDYAAHLIGSIPGVAVPLAGAHFKEFVVNVDGTGRSVAEVNAALRARGVLGGKDLSAELPELGQSALWCVTEVHTPDDIRRMAAALQEIVA